MIQAGRFEELEKIQLKDPSLFRDKYTLIDPNNMPAQNMDNLYNNSIFTQWEDEEDEPRIEEEPTYHYKTSPIDINKRFGCHPILEQCDNEHTCEDETCIDCMMMDQNNIFRSQKGLCSSFIWLKKNGID